MARQALPIKLDEMQAIINAEEKKYQGGLIDFYQHCCDIYNNRYCPQKPLYGQIIYNYVKKSGLRTNFVSTKKKVLTPEHLEKLRAGRMKNNDTDIVDDDDSNVRTKYKELFDIVKDVNTQCNTDYRLEIHNNYGQISRTGYSGPCLSLRHLKIFLLGLKPWESAA